MNQFIAVIKSTLTTNQISMNEFKDAFIAGKAKLVTLNNSGNFAPFLFINYNREKGDVLFYPMQIHPILQIGIICIGKKRTSPFFPLF